MKIDVYSEQYRSAQSSFDAGKIGGGAESLGKGIADLGNTLVGAVQKKREQDDDFLQTKVYAQTMEEAAKLKRDYEATADPDNFEADIEKQRYAIQGLIAKNSSLFKTSTAQSNFNKLMTSQLEVGYMGNVLNYGYKLQEERYKKLRAEGNEQLDTALLSGNSLVTLPDVINTKISQNTALAKRYNISKMMLDQINEEDTTTSVRSYAYGKVLTDPYAVRDLMIGDGIEKFQAYKQSIGEPFSIEDFMANDDLRKEYAKSEFGTKYANYVQHLDYETRMDLWKVASTEIEKREKDELKLKALQNSMSEYDLDTQLDAGILQAKTAGSLPANLYGVRTITAKDDPRLNSSVKIKMGSAKPGPLSKGNSFTPQAKDFSNALDNKLRQMGYTTYLTSSLRPGDNDSAHKTGSATDIQVFKGSTWSEQGLIKAYTTAVKYYPDKLRKGKSLFEVDPERLPYIKAALEKEGIDTSYVNWEQSKKYGVIAKRNSSQHIHFGIEPKADYTIAGGASSTKFVFKTEQGYQRYKQQMAAGKTPQECYDAGRKDDLKLLEALDSYNAVHSITAATNADGTALDPSQYGRVLEARKQSILNNKSLSSEDRVRELKALEVAQTEIPKLQQLYREDPVDFLIKTNQARNPQEAAIVQQKRYGISPENVNIMTTEEAKIKADQLYSKFSGQEAVGYVRSNAVNPATLKQISKYLVDDSKSNMILYSAMASDALAGQFVGAIQNWDTVNKAIKQDAKTFPSNWKATAIAEFQKDPMMKNYFADLAKTRPEERTKMLDALTSVYAYRMTMGNDTRNSKEIIKDITQNIIGNNYSTATVSSPRLGNTQLNIANSLLSDKGNMHKIQRVASMALGLGIDGNQVYIGYDILNTDIGGKTGAALTTVQEQNKKHYIEGIQKTAKLSSSSDGFNGIFTWQDTKGRYAGSSIKHKDNQKDFQIPYKEMISIYNEAYALKETYAKKRGTDKYYARKFGQGEIAISEATAMDQALQVILNKKYPWLNKGNYDK